MEKKSSIQSYLLPAVLLVVSIALFLLLLPNNNKSVFGIKDFFSYVLKSEIAEKVYRLSKIPSRLSLLSVVLADTEGPQLLRPILSINKNEGERIEMTVYAADPDTPADQLVFYVYGIKSGDFTLTNNGNGSATFIWQPNALQTSADTPAALVLEFTVSDPQGNKNTESMDLTINNVSFVYGTVKDRKGSPIAGATVSVAPPVLALWDRGFTKITDDAGRFDFPEDLNGEYWFIINKTGYARYKEKIIVGSAPQEYNIVLFAYGEHEVVNLLDNRNDYPGGSIPQYEKFELTFDIKWFGENGEYDPLFIMPWSINQDYIIGEQVRFNNNIYENIKSTPLTWRVGSYWDTVFRYKKDDVVRHNNKIYKDIKDGEHIPYTADYAAKHNSVASSGEQLAPEGNEPGTDAGNAFWQEDTSYSLELAPEQAGGYWRKTKNNAPTISPYVPYDERPLPNEYAVWTENTTYYDGERIERNGIIYRNIKKTPRYWTAPSYYYAGENLIYKGKGYLCLHNLDVSYAPNAHHYAPDGDWDAEYYWAEDPTLNLNVVPGGTPGVPGDWREYWQANPPDPIPAKIGVSVDGLFSSDDFATVITQPGFLYQDFDRQDFPAEGGSPAVRWTYPKNKSVWKIRFAYNENKISSEKIWKYKIRIKDITGETIYNPDNNTFTVIPSENRGFAKVSETDKRYFETSDGQPLNLVGINNLGTNPFTNTFELDDRMTEMGQKGINFARVWWQGSQGPTVFGISGQGETREWKNFALSSEKTLQNGLVSGILPDSLAPSERYGLLYNDYVFIKPNTRYQMSTWFNVNNTETTGEDGGYWVKPVGVLETGLDNSYGSEMYPWKKLKNTDGKWELLTNEFTTSSNHKKLDVYIMPKNAVFGNYKSPDPMGIAWEKHQNLQDVAKDNVRTVLSFATAPNGYLFAGSAYQGVLRSMDNGETWHKVGIDNHDILSIAVHPEGRVFAGHHEQLWISDDYGNTWRISNLGGYCGDPVHCLKISKIFINNEGDIFLGTPNGVLYSSESNYGNSFQFLNNGIGNDKNIQAFSQNYAGEAYTATANKVYKLYVDGSGNKSWIWISNNNGLGNISINSMAFNDDSGHLFVGGRTDGIFRYSPADNKWTETSSGFINRGLNQIIWHNANMYLATDDYIYQSASNGEHWEQIKENFDSPYVTTMGVDTQNNLHAFTTGKIFFNNLTIREKLPDGALGPNIVNRSDLNLQTNFSQLDSWIADYEVNLAQQNNIYLKIVLEELLDQFYGKIQPDGKFSDTASGNNVYGWSGHASRTYQQYFWRYIIARYGYSANIHSFEFANETAPYVDLPVSTAVAFGGWFSNSQNDPNKHLASNSTTNDFPSNMWTKPEMSYADIHQYFGWDIASGGDAIWPGWDNWGIKYATDNPGGEWGNEDTFIFDTAVSNSAVDGGKNSFKIKTKASATWTGSDYEVNNERYSGLGAKIAKPAPDVNGDTKVKVSFYVKAKHIHKFPGFTDGRDGRPGIKYTYGGLKQAIRVPETDPAQGDEYDWQKVESEWTITAKHADYLWIQFIGFLNNSDQDGEAWIDNVEIKDAATGQILNYNGNFEYIESQAYDTASAHQSYSQTLRQFGYNKPIVRGETAIELKQPYENSDLNEDLNGIWWKKLVWSNLDSGGLYEMYWNTYPIFNKDLGYKWPAYAKNYLNFVSDIDLDGGEYKDAQAQVSNIDIRVIGQKNSAGEKAHLWIDNAPYTWKAVVNHNKYGTPLPLPVSGTVILSGFKEGAYKIEWRDTSTGEIVQPEGYTLSYNTENGDIVLTIPDTNPLVSDIAAKITFDTTPAAPAQPINLEVDDFDNTACGKTGGARVRLSWQFFNQSAYQIQIDNNSDFSSPEIETLKISSDSQAFVNESNLLSWNNTSYSWRLKVWKEDKESEWVSGPAFTTPEHSYPSVGFDWSPKPSEVNKEVAFINQSNVFAAGDSMWAWELQGGNPGNSDAQNPKVTFSSPGQKSVKLTVTDSDGFSCAASKTVNAQAPLPEWRETPPF